MKRIETFSTLSNIMRILLTSTIQPMRSSISRTRKYVQPVTSKVKTIQGQLQKGGVKHLVTMSIVVPFYTKVAKALLVKPDSHVARVQGKRTVIGKLIKKAKAFARRILGFVDALHPTMQYYAEVSFEERIAEVDVQVRTAEVEVLECQLDLSTQERLVKVSTVERRFYVEIIPFVRGDEDGSNG